MPQPGFDPNPGRGQPLGILVVGIVFLAISHYLNLRGAFATLIVLGSLLSVMGAAGLVDPRLLLGFTVDGKAHFPRSVHYTSLALCILGFAAGIVLAVFVFKAVSL
jgi:hypothetical protein